MLLDAFRTVSAFDGNVFSCEWDAINLRLNAWAQVPCVAGALLHACMRTRVRWAVLSPEKIYNANIIYIYIYILVSLNFTINTQHIFN